MPNHDGLCVVVVDILRALIELEERIPRHEVQTINQHKQMYINDNLWKDITNCIVPDTTVIELPKLRQILEKFQILGDEKDGM